MIQFTLKCAKGHETDSWFQSSEAYEKLRLAGLVSCTACGSHEVEKALMAPRVFARRDDKGDAEEGSGTRALSGPPTPAEEALAELRRRVEEKSDYVGPQFAQLARDIHEGIAPKRSIYGEARPEEAIKLIEEGVPVAPLPFNPRRKSN